MAGRFLICSFVLAAVSEVTSALREQNMRTPLLSESSTNREPSEGLLIEKDSAAEAKQLNMGAKVQAAMLTLALKQMALELELLYARQKVLRSYIHCACPVLGSDACLSEEVSHNPGHINQHHINNLTSDPALTSVRVLKLMKFNLEQLQMNHKYLAEAVHCLCPNTASCNKAIDQGVYDNVNMFSGKTDGEYSEDDGEIL